MISRFLFEAVEALEAGRQALGHGVTLIPSDEHRFGWEFDESNKITLITGEGRYVGDSWVNQLCWEASEYDAVQPGYWKTSFPNIEIRIPGGSVVWYKTASSYGEATESGGCFFLAPNFAHLPEEERKGAQLFGMSIAGHSDGFLEIKEDLLVEWFDSLDQDRRRAYVAWLAAIVPPLLQNPYIGWSETGKTGFTPREEIQQRMDALLKKLSFEEESKSSRSSEREDRGRGRPGGR